MKLTFLIIPFILLSQNASAQWGDSGIKWIDVTFDWCIQLLLNIADYLGITYEEINIWLFVIILPLLLFLSFALNIYLLFFQKNK